MWIDEMPRNMTALHAAIVAEHFTGNRLLLMEVQRLGQGRHNRLLESFRTIFGQRSVGDLTCDTAQGPDWEARLVSGRSGPS